MAISRPYMGTKQADFVDRSRVDIPTPSGIYKGVVKNIDTNTRTSRLQVYVSQFGGADPNDPSNWRLVSYASPFMGTTQGKSYPYGPAQPSENVFDRTQQSYGFYMTPPDIGSEVLCCWLEGVNEGYWFACISSSITRQMIPAIGSVPWDKIDKNSIQQSGIEALLRPGNPYPVAEVNENIANVYTAYSSISDIPKPLHLPQTVRLIIQGLDTDDVRGVVSSSSQRDPISTVFGFSSPGRPYGQQDPANNPNLQERLLTGNFNPEDFNVTTRVGGHSLVMDDGDILNKNNMVRIKTAAGHQILMNDSEGLFYIANSNGTAWIELTQSGDVLIYGQRDLAVRTEGNLMMHSDKNINFYAERNIQIAAAGSIRTEAQSIQANASKSLNLFGGQAQLKSQSSLGVVAGASMSIKASGSIGINGGSIALNGGGGGGEISPPSKIQKYNLPDTVRDQGLWTATPGSLTSINTRVPTHEPYIRGDINAAIRTGTAAANAYTTDVSGNPISPPLNVSKKGISTANNVALSRAATADVFIKQPEPANSMGALDKDQLRAYMAQTGYSESNGNYNVVNQFGYQGKYQLGSLALQDLGYIKPGTPQTTEAMSNPNNWTGKGGVYSSADFLNNAQVQESAMYDYTKKNYSVLQSKGIITSDSSTSDIAGYLSSSHLVGAGGTAKWVSTGQSVADANGTTAATYFNRGVYSQTQVPVIVASNASKTNVG